MTKRIMVAMFLATSVVGPAALAQQAPERGGIRTETQRRLSQGDPTYDVLNLLGLFGLLGLAGLRRGAHPDDGYHPSPLE